MNHNLRQAFCLIGALLLQCATPCEGQQQATPIPSETKFVSVTGGVRAPQRIPWSPSLTLLSAIDACGGVIPGAAPRKVRIVRGSERILITMRPILQKQEPDPKLQAGDMIEVPE